MTSAVLGAQTTFGISSAGSPASYTTVAEVLSIGPVGATAPEVDVTNLDSTAMEYIGGLPDGQSVDVQMNWLAGNTQQTALRAAVGTTIGVKIGWPGSPTTTATFSFVVLGFNMGETTPTAQQTASATGRISGAISWS